MRESQRPGNLRCKTGRAASAAVTMSDGAVPVRATAGRLQS
jgi:hypothetical protein